MHDPALLFKKNLSRGKEKCALSLMPDILTRFSKENPAKTTGGRSRKVDASQRKY